MWIYHGWYILQIYCNMYLCIKHIVEIKHSFIKTVSRKNFIILMAVILEKSSKVHFVCKFFLATSENWNLEVLGFPMIYISLCPSLDTDMANFRGLCNGLYVLTHIYSWWHISTIAEAEMFCDDLPFLLQSFLFINRLINTNLKTELDGNISLVLQGKNLIIICQHHLQAKCL